MGLSRRSWLSQASCLAVAACAPPTLAEQGDTPSRVSFAAGHYDTRGRLMGGTEMRVLAAHQGQLFAGNGYWKDTPGLAGKRGAQILRLDRPEGDWTVDHDFDERLPDGRRRHLAVSALREVVFHTDAYGRALGRPVGRLVASTWDVSGTRTVFVRDDATGRWAGTTLAHDPPAANFLPQIRCFGAHRESGTGADLVFAGDSRGIFRGACNPSVPGALRWEPAPELALASLPVPTMPGLTGRLRISSFAVADGVLFAAVGQQIYRRHDGAAADWELFYTNPRPHYSQTGLRGLTAIPAGNGRQVLLAAVEGNAARIVRIDPADGSETTDLALGALLGTAWGTRVSYVIAAYNEMTPVRGLDGPVLLIGLEAFIPPTAPRPPGHVVLNVVNGLEAGGWYLVRTADGRYVPRRVDAVLPGIGRSLVAVRAILASPFAGDAGAIYLAGYDANGEPAHDTAWIVRADAALAVSGR